MKLWITCRLNLFNYLLCGIILKTELVYLKIIKNNKNKF